MKNQRGQISIEIVLMTTVIVLVAVTVSQAFRKNEFVANLVSGPWRSVSGLIQNGVWGTPTETMGKHPNQFNRISTVKGDLVE